MPTITQAEAAPSDNADKLTRVRLLRGLGGGRYAVAVGVSALGGGLIRPFLLLYAVTISHLAASQAGLALSMGFVFGLALVPLTGRWIDSGARTTVVVTTLLLRVAGLGLLLAVPGPVGFICTCLLQGVGNQTGPIAQAAVVSSLARGFERDAVLAAIRSLGNAGLGVGALLATVAVGSGAIGMRWLAAATACGYLISAVLVSTVRLPDDPERGTRRRPGTAIEPADRPVLRRLTILGLANLPFAFCFDVLEVALPIVIVTQLHAASAWSSGIFVANTAMVIAVQLPVVIWMARRPRRRVFALAGCVLASSYLGFLVAGGSSGIAGAAGIAAVSIAYNLGEVLYTGVSTALVIDAAPVHLRGRVLAQWQLSQGLGRAIAPLAITTALSISAPALWLPLAAATLLGAALVTRFAPVDSDPRGKDVDAHAGPEPVRRHEFRRARAVRRAVQDTRRLEIIRRRRADLDRRPRSSR